MSEPDYPYPKKGKEPNTSAPPGKLPPQPKSPALPPGYPPHLPSAKTKRRSKKKT